jgi:hypothetical protein
MRRRLRNLAAAVSLALLAVTCALWVRSYLVSDHLARVCLWGEEKVLPFEGRDVALRSAWAQDDLSVGGGAVGVARVVHRDARDPEGLREQVERLLRMRPGGPRPFHRAAEPRFPQPRPGAGGSGGGYSLFGFYLRRYDPGDTLAAEGFDLIVPLWPFAAAFAVLPARWWWLWRRRRRRIARGCCQHCGYDLQGTPDRCPECASVPERTGASRPAARAAAA